jgi:signal transduction histidine kinase
MERVLALVAADYRRPVGPIAIAAMLAAAAAAASGPSAGPLNPSAALSLGLLSTAPIAVIRRFPGPAIGTVLTANAMFVVFGRLSWPAAALAGWLIALAACPLVLPRRAAVLAVALTECAVLLGMANLGRNVTPWDASAAEALAVLAAWGAGELFRARRQSAAERAEAAERLRHLSERDAVARERASIARELHDVVAHHVSMIAVRAATAPYALAGLPERGRAAFAEIADEARSALTELRVVLGVLRAPDSSGSEVAPQPRIADLDALLRRVAGAGTSATMTVSGPVRQLPGSVELCCYRIVQEALTNARRHAPGSEVTIELRYTAAGISVLVANGVPGWRPELPAAARHGYGLPGLRERVAMLRGELEAGPDDCGGFAVSAMLPAPAPASDLAPAPAPASDLAPTPAPALASDLAPAADTARDPA